MKPRPTIATVVAGFQTGMAIILCAAVVYLWVVSLSSRVTHSTNAVQVALEMRIAGTVVLLPATLAVLASWGLWKNRAWGWWIALVLSVLILTPMILDVIEERAVELDDLAATVPFLIFAVLLLVPKVRRFYWSRGRRQDPAAS